MAVIAQKNSDINVTVVDLNAQHIKDWNYQDLSKLPIYEPCLDTIVAEARGRNLFFSTNVDDAIDKLTASQILHDLDYLNTQSEKENRLYLQTNNDPYKDLEGAHAVAVLTEWDEFITYNWQANYDVMQKPAFVFHGRNILDKQKLEAINFVYTAIGS